MRARPETRGHVGLISLSSPVCQTPRLLVCTCHRPDCLTGPGNTTCPFRRPRIRIELFVQVSYILYMIKKKILLLFLLSVFLCQNRLIEDQTTFL